MGFFLFVSELDPKVLFSLTKRAPALANDFGDFRVSFSRVGGNDLGMMVLPV